MKTLHNNETPVRLDKLEYYSKLPTSHLVKEAEIAEIVLSTKTIVSDEKINDSKIILNELNKRLKN